VAEDRFRLLRAENRHHFKRRVLNSYGTNVPTGMIAWRG
jgi:hypothetical protein